MRWLVVAVLATGCGRFGFDSLELTEPEVCVPGVLDDGSVVLCTADELAALTTSPDQWGGTFVLGADIDLAGVTVELIGTEQMPFTGVLDGDGHTLRNLRIDRPTEDDVGLVRWAIGAARIKNLHVVDAEVTGNNGVGILLGYSNGAIKVHDVTVTGVVRGIRNVGGVAGYVECYFDQGCTGLVFERITADVDVAAIDNGTALAGVSAGGIVGGTYSNNGDTEHGAFTDLTVAGAIAGRRYIGGIVGDAELVRLRRCVSSATITAVEDGGGLFGASVFIATEVFDSHTSGTVTCGNMCGGAIGFLQGSAYRVSSSARVECTDDSCGGLTGYLEGNCHECMATGPVSGTTDIGGLAGQAWLSMAWDMRDSYANGTVDGTTNVGGLVGTLGSTRVQRSYSASNVTGTSSVGGLFGNVAGTNHAVTDSFFYGNVIGSTAMTTVGWVLGSASVALSITNTHAGGTCANATSCNGTATLGSPQLLYMAATAPLDTWDFTTIWKTRTDAFPTLRAVTAP